MCGIAGIIDLRGSATIDVAGLKRMAKVMHHRGPDSRGIYVDNRAGLVSNRLSIVDLAGGTQPIHNEDRSLWIVYNGEVYNYPDLKERLLKKGHTFYTNTDTEVVLHMYEENGPSCLEQFNGQFAFAIWDCDRHELFIARDRVGIRPLHYMTFQGKLIFASEIKSIFAYDSTIPRQLDPRAFEQIFTFWTTLPGYTAFEGIQELPAGHYMRVRAGQTTLTRYWEIPYYPEEEKLEEQSDQITQRIRELLYDAVRIRLRADVPVGTYLSGGLDSSGLTSLVARYFQQGVHTFGIRFAERDYDEGDQQRLLAGYLGAEHHVLHVSNAQIASALSEFIWHCEKPILRTSPVPLFLLSEFVRQNDRKVVLTGEGADEVFGGYNIFREAKVRRFWAQQPTSHLRPLLLKRLYPYIFSQQRASQMLASFFGQGLTDIQNPFYSHQLRWSTTARNKTFFSKSLQNTIGKYNPIEELQGMLPENFNNWDYFSKAQYLEMKVFMSTYLLSSQGDRPAMAHSLEIRVPYLDHRLLDFMARVPTKWKIRGLNEKYLLKQVYSEMLPEVIRTRPKQPYRSPITTDLLSRKVFHFQNMEPFFNTQLLHKYFKKFDGLASLSEGDMMLLAGVVSTALLRERFLSQPIGLKYKSEEPIYFIDKRN